MTLEQGKIKINNFLIVSFATANTPYEEVIKKYLLPSLEKLNLPHYIEVIDNQGSWLKNVAQKPKVILNALEKYPSYNLVVLDADAEIKEFPVLFNNIPEEYDFACFILDWNTWYRNNSNIKEVLSGTLFLRNTEKIKELVTKWLNLATNSYEWEQKCLAKILEETKTKIYSLPLEYCYINSLPDGKEPYIKCEKPIIIHNQVSRTLKKQIRL